MDKKRIVIVFIFIIMFIILIIVSSLYYNNKYAIYFETGTDEVILTKYVKRNSKVDKPTTPIKEGYVFKEWQLDGKTYDFNNEVTKDIILTAKWIKEEYVTIKFDTNSNYEIEPKKILKGDSIDKLPESYKEDYEFIGWYLNNKLYNNELIYDDIKLIAIYKNDKINSLYKIGDKIKIIGRYAKSAYSYDYQDYNMKAIGWEREILDIIENSEYPYVIGNSKGVTGFFKASSIEKV